MPNDFSAPSGSRPWRSKVPPSWIPSTGALLVVLLGWAAFHMAPLLWIHFDDFANTQGYQERWGELWRSSHYNRFPLFGLVVYPLLLAVPAGLAHGVVILVHLATALLARRGLIASGVPDRQATLAAALYLLSPAALEPAFWLAASTLIFGAFLIAGGTLALLARREVIGTVLLFLASLFSEGLLIPAGGVAFFASRRRGAGFWRALVPAVTVGTLYLVFQLARRLVSTSGPPLQYAVGLERVSSNLTDLLLMSVGAASSSDAAWHWLHVGSPRVVTQYLSPGWLVIAFVCTTAGSLWMLRATQGAVPRPADRSIARRVVLACSFLAAASLLIYLPIVGNSMQSRYAFPCGGFLALAVGVGAGLLPRQLRGWTSGVGCVAVLGVLLFNVWSTGWKNWYAAGKVEQRILRDARRISAESRVSSIHLVNPPMVVGVAYAFTRDWAYLGAGRLLIAPAFRLQADSIWDSDAVKPGGRFSDRPCVFMRWTSGEATWGTLLDVGEGLQMDCTTGEVVVAGAASAPRAHRGQVLVRGEFQPSRQILRQDFTAEE